MAHVALARWSAEDLWLLQAGNTAEMTVHLGGPESDDQVADRHERYLRYWQTGEARTFRLEADGNPVGAVCWWSTSWRDHDVHEVGWFVLPEAQGQGVARRGVGLVLDDVRAHGEHPLLMAFPSELNVASNALCAAAGLTLRGQDDVLFRGTALRVNAWGVDLALRHGAARASG